MGKYIPILVHFKTIILEYLWCRKYRMGTENVIMETESLNTRFPGFLCLLCYVWDTAVKCEVDSPTKDYNKQNTNKHLLAALIPNYKKNTNV